MKKKSDALTLREGWKLFCRAMGTLYRRRPGAVLSCLLLKAWESLTPYVAVFFSARVIGELAGSRDPIALRNWVLAALFAAAFTAGGSALLNRWKNKENCTLWYDAQFIVQEKYQSLDYMDAETTEMRDLLQTIHMNQMGPGFGLMSALWAAERLVDGACVTLGGVALTAGLFLARVPEGAGPLTVLNSPLCVLGVLGAMVLITLAGSALRNSGNKELSSRAGDLNQDNALFSHSCGLIYHRKYAADVRVYGQEKYTMAFMYDKKGTFMSKGPFARITRRRVGPKKAAGAGVNALFAGVAYLYVCLKALGGAFGVGMVTQYAAAITQLAAGVGVLFGEVGFMPVNGRFLKMVFQLLDAPNHMYMGSLTTEKRSDREYDIEFRDVGFRYPGSDFWALRHVNVKFRVGGRLAVVGQNGSGKSTFIKLLCRLYDPEEGEIRLNGVDIRKYNYDDYMGIFSVVFQDFALTEYSLGPNVAAREAFDRERVEDCLEKAGFGDRLDSLPQGLNTCLGKGYEDGGVDLSGGEAQKVAIARALYKDAPFIILDEPTAALDPIAEEEIYTRFGQIITDKTAIYISHRLSSCRFCEEILVFDQGTVVQQGSHDGLVADVSGKYNELWYAQAQYYSEEERRRLL